MLRANSLRRLLSRRPVPRTRLGLRPKLVLESLEARDVPATITVTTTLDTIAPDGVTSLREAINDANIFPGDDIIAFNIPGGGVKTINVTSVLPTITGTVTIDGYTQPGSSANTLSVGNDAVLNIELNGTAAGTHIGLKVFSSNTTIRGLVINRFNPGGYAAILLSSGTGNTIAGNFIGTDASGTFDLGQGEGVAINSGSSGNTIGGSAPQDRNVISGNERGIVLRSTTNNTIAGNYIGTDKTGLQDLGNDFDGIRIEGTSSQNTIGGTTPGAGNVISGNSQQGVLFEGDGVDKNIIQGNIIGLGSDGSTLIPNADNGVSINGGDFNDVGDSEDGRNTISGNQANGILLNFDAEVNDIVDNYFGTDSLGVTAKGNGQFGVLIANGSSYSTVERNVISANGGGVRLRERHHQ